MMLTALAVVMQMSSCSEKQKAKVKQPTRVKTEVVTAEAGAAGQQYVGIVEEREATAVSFTGMGVVRRVLVSEGQAVSRGQLIAEMDDTQARNMLASAEATMAQANDGLQRMTMLHEAGSLPEAQWVEVQSRVAQAKAQLEVARKNLADCRLVAPVSGIVGRKAVKAGETALPSQAVVTILDVSAVKVKVSIPEAEMNGISATTASTVHVEAAGKTVSGGRIEKGVVADALTHTYDIRINVDNGDRRLLPGMVASVSLGSEKGKVNQRSTAEGKVNSEQFASAPFVPVTAVQRNADGSLFVWTVAGDSTVHRSKVGIGATSGNRVAVINGIGDGQRIVTEGYQKLSEGSKVVY